MNKYMKFGIYTAIGAVLGYGYYYFIGCNGGACPLTSTWYVSTLYGAAIGLIAGFPSKDKSIKVKADSNQESQ